MSATREGSDRDGRERPDTGGPERPDTGGHGRGPGRVPAGRWPADLDRSPDLSQPSAVNQAMASLLDAPGLLTVNGPAQAGETAPLRDLIAAIVVARAGRLAQLPRPAEAFDLAAGDQQQPGRARHAVTPLNQALAGLEIVVASADSGAAENLTAGLSGAAGIGAQWRDAAARLDHFTATARLVHGNGAWAMVAAGLGDAASRRAFTESFWRGMPGQHDGGMAGLLGRAAGHPVNWDAARDEFLAARQKASNLAAGGTEVALAQARLRSLRRDAGVSYASITAEEDTLRALAGARVAAERSLRAACHRHLAAAKALDAHTRAKPGLRASLRARLGARREWRARQGALGAALRDRAAGVDTAQRASAEIRAQFAAAVHARAESAGTLRRLTAECAAAQEVIARGDAESAAARTELFLAALALHKALITAQAPRVSGNLNALVDFLEGKGEPEGRDLLAAWQTLFLVVPVVSATVASVPALFAGLGRESIGWLVTEAGQAPREAAGAAWRAKRTVAVGAGPGTAPGRGKLPR
jgi:hypothetical protein